MATAPATAPATTATTATTALSCFWFGTDPPMWPLLGEFALVGLHCNVAISDAAASFHLNTVPRTRVRGAKRQGVVKQQPWAWFAAVFDRMPIHKKLDPEMLAAFGVTNV